MPENWTKPTMTITLQEPARLELAPYKSLDNDELSRADRGGARRARARDC